MRSKTFLAFALVTWLSLFNNPASASTRLGKVLRLRADTQCPMPGYYRDDSDCRKFYRCAEHPTGVPGQNVISKVVFNCPMGTIYDEALSSCNHVSFVRDISSTCDTSNPVSGTGGNDNSGSSISMPSMMSTTDASSSSGSDSSSPESSTMTPPPSNSNNMPPLNPLLPPSNLPPLPIIPGDQQNPPMMPPQLPPFPGENPDGQPPLPVFPGLMPGDMGQQQPPLFPGLPMPGDQGQGQPSFPAIPGFPMPGNPSDQFSQMMQPAAISVPVMSGSQQQQQQQNQQFTFPSISIPNLPGTQKHEFPFNFQTLSGNFQMPSHSISNIPGVSQISASDNQLQHQQTNVQTPFDQNNLQNQENSHVAISVPIENQQNNGIQVVSGTGAASWVNPQSFPDKQTSAQTVVNNQGNPGWVVPNNFPTFYSLGLGGRTPLLLAGQQVPRSVPTTYFII